MTGEACTESEAGTETEGETETGNGTETDAESELKQLFVGHDNKTPNQSLAKPEEKTRRASLVEHEEQEVAKEKEKDKADSKKSTSPPDKNIIVRVSQEKEVYDDRQKERENKERRKKGEKGKGRISSTSERSLTQKYKTKRRNKHR